jgi:hypothetical protein
LNIPSLAILFNISRELDKGSKDLLEESKEERRECNIFSL